MTTDAELIKKLNVKHKKVMKQPMYDYIIPVSHKWWRKNKEEAEGHGITLIEKDHG